MAIQGWYPLDTWDQYQNEMIRRLYQEAVSKFETDIDTIQDDDQDTKVQTEESSDEDKIRFDTAGTQRAQIDSDGLTLASGASVNEFSTDDTLAGDSDDAVPTEKSTKAYVDAVTQGLWEVDGTEHQLITADEVDMQSKKIINVTDPASDQDAATKKYVDDNTGGYINAAQYYEPDQTCVLALAGYCNDPATATTFKDSSVYGNDFTIGSTPPEGVGQISKTCMDLDGTADYITLGQASAGDLGDMDNITVELWVKRDTLVLDTNVNQHLLEAVNMSIYFSGESEATAEKDKLNFLLEVDSGQLGLRTAAQYQNITDFYYIVMTYQATDHTLRGYVNGVAVGTDDTKTGDIDVATGGIAVFIGMLNDSSDFFNGKIDGFKIYRRQMSATEILARYNAFV